MKRIFFSQMLGPAKAWVSQYAIGQFTTYKALKAPFLETFRHERMNAHVLICLTAIIQKGRSIHEYAAKFRRLLNQLLLAEQSAIPLQCEYFIWGLDNPEVLLTQDLQATTLLDIVDLAIKVEKLWKNNTFIPSTNFGNATTPVQTFSASAYTPFVWHT